MYAQHRRSAEVPSVVPRNYSGNAFRYPPPTPLSPSVREPAVSAEQEKAADEVMPIDVTMDAEDLSAEAELREQASLEDDAVAEDKEGRSLLAALLPHGIGNEELLLLGLLFLLSGEKGGAWQDLPLYLLLLLFCG